MDHEPENVEQPEKQCPRLANWLWRPWYAKLLWGAAAIFWILVALDSLSVHHILIDRVYEDLFYPFALLFHPFVIVPALSFGFVRAWVAFVTQDKPADDRYESLHGGNYSLYPKHLDPTNPLDPRFIAHPVNPTSPTWRDRHLWGRD